MCIEEDKWKKADLLTEEKERLLHGDCPEFVKENYQEGDKIICVLEWDENVSRECLMHSFLNREKQFIDVRGTTRNFDDVMDAFDFGEYREIELTNLNDFVEFLENLESSYNKC